MDEELMQAARAGEAARAGDLVDMDEELMQAARAGDTSDLYRLIRQDPYVLDRIDKIPFVDTPLHTAASSGNTLCAVEIASLKPSFGRKLNQDGLSPIHLALESGHDEIVRRLISLDSGLVCVPGKDRITPLHAVTERENLDLLAAFLFACPESIKKVTIRGETAVHIAVKNQKLRALEILLGWLHGWANRNEVQEVLERKDDEGNTVLHIAVQTNQHQIAYLLADEVNVNARNSEGLTAYDLLLQLSSQQDIKKFKKILLKKGAKRASSLSNEKPFEEILRPKLPLYVRWARYILRMQKELNSNKRDILMVVAVLVVTATYQAILQPPRGLRQAAAIDNNPTLLNCSTTDLYNTTNNPALLNCTIRYNTTSTKIGNETELEGETVMVESELEGKTVMGESEFMLFSIFNTSAFYASIGLIYSLLPNQFCSVLLFMSLQFLSVSYSTNMIAISPPSRVKSPVAVIMAILEFYSIVVFVGQLVYWKGKEKITRGILARGDGTWEHFLRWKESEI